MSNTTIYKIDDQVQRVPWGEREPSSPFDGQSNARFVTAEVWVLTEGASSCSNDALLSGLGGGAMVGVLVVNGYPVPVGYAQPHWFADHHLTHKFNHPSTRSDTLRDLTAMFLLQDEAMDVLAFVNSDLHLKQLLPVVYARLAETFIGAKLTLSVTVDPEEDDEHLRIGVASCAEDPIAMLKKLRTLEKDWWIPQSVTSPSLKRLTIGLILHEFRLGGIPSTCKRPKGNGRRRLAS